jgi:hypothetical protein
LLQHHARLVSIDEMLGALGSGAPKSRIGKGCFHGLDSRDALRTYVARAKRLLAAQVAGSPLKGIRIVPRFVDGKPHAGFAGYCLLIGDEQEVSIAEQAVVVGKSMSIWAQTKPIDMGLFKFEQTVGKTHGVLTAKNKSVCLTADEVATLKCLWGQQGTAVKNVDGLNTQRLWNAVRELNNKIEHTFGHADVISPNYMTFNGYTLRTAEEVVREQKLYAHIASLPVAVAG